MWEEMKSKGKTEGWADHVESVVIGRTCLYSE